MVVCGCGSAVGQQSTGLALLQKYMCFGAEQWYMYMITYIGA